MAQIEVRLEAFRLLLKHHAAAQARDPESYGFPYDLDNWREHLNRMIDMETML